MSTIPLADTLYQLQQLDLELERVIAEQQSLLKSLQGNPTLQKVLKEHNDAQQQLHLGLQAQKDAEWALEELSRRLTAHEQRLYSGMVTNPKELSSLQQEVQRLRAQQNRQEEKTLEVIDTTEGLLEIAHQKTQALQQAEEAWKQESATLVARRDQQATRQQELEAKRTQLVGGIDAALIQRYETLRRTKQGRAISKVAQNSCQWCRVILTPSELQHVRTQSELQTCSNCGRILYLER